MNSNPEYESIDGEVQCKEGSEFERGLNGTTYDATQSSGLFEGREIESVLKRESTVAIEPSLQQRLTHAARRGSKRNLLRLLWPFRE